MLLRCAIFRQRALAVGEAALTLLFFMSGGVRLTHDDANVFDAQFDYLLGATFAERRASFQPAQLTSAISARAKAH